MHVEQGRVAYIILENPDDVCAKLMVALYDLGIDPAVAENIVIIDCRAGIEPIFRDLKDDAEKNGPFQAVAFDTYQAGFDGSDFNSNGEVLHYTQRLRTLTQLPGKPSVLASRASSQERDAR